MGRSLFIDAAASSAETAVRSAKPVEGCWFCLSNPNADVELVASVGELGRACTAARSKACLHACMHASSVCAGAGKKSKMLAAAAGMALQSAWPEGKHAPSPLADPLADYHPLPLLLPWLPWLPWLSGWQARSATWHWTREPSQTSTC